MIISTVGSYQVSLSFPNSGNSSTSEVARPSVLTDNKVSYIGHGFLDITSFGRTVCERGHVMSVEA